MDRRLVGRLLAALGILALGLAAGRQSFALAISDRQPAEALRLDPAQPAALALTTYASLIDNPRPIEQAAAQRTALEALARDPTEVRAVLDLALVRELEHRPAAAAGLMRYAQDLSRRNLLTQLWWIEYWSARGDVARTLDHYDIALRTSPGAPAVLFPILVNAVADANLANALARLLARRPAWGEQFVQQLAQSGTDVGGLARVVGQLAVLGTPVADRTLATAIDRLLAAQQPLDAWALYARYRPASAGGVLRNPRFAATAAEPTAFDWVLSQDGVSTSIEQDGLHVAAAPGGGGIAARQVIRLAPGPHRLRFRYAVDDQSGAAGGSRPVLSVRCFQTESPLTQTDDSAGQDVTLDVVVPAGCPAQVVGIALQSGDGPGGSAIVVREVAALG